MRLTHWIACLCLVPSLALSHVSEGLGGVIFDWPGTLLEQGVMLPVAAFQAVFAEAGVPISEAEARGPMGHEQKSHIRELLEAPAIAARWEQHYGKPPMASDVDDLFENFIPLQIAVLSEQGALLPGALETINFIQEQGWQVATTTGFRNDMLALLDEQAFVQGFPHPHDLTADILSTSRLNVPTSRLVKIDNTLAGIEAGHHAGAWTVMVIQSAHAMGLSPERLAAISDNERLSRLEEVIEQMRPYAHYVVPTLAELPSVLARIDIRVQAGEEPRQEDRLAAFWGSRASHG